MSKRVLIPFRHLKKVEPYVRAALAAGLEPVTADVALPVDLEDVEGLLLMGGSDVDPRNYHAQAEDETDPPDAERDRVELALLARAAGKDLPVFAICRGLQILNVQRGGTLIQHLPSAARHDPELEDKAQAAHEVSIDEKGLLREIAGAGRWQVNSRHHQAAGKIGQGLRVVARDTEDGTVEALEQDGARFVLAVQWHPEDQLSKWPAQLELFRRFAKAL